MVAVLDGHVSPCFDSNVVWEADEIHFSGLLTLNQHCFYPYNIGVGIELGIMAFDQSTAVFLLLHSVYFH